MSEPTEQIKALGRDLHYLGVANSVEIPAKLYEMGWRKSPRVVIEPTVIPARATQDFIASPIAQAVNPVMTPQSQRWMQ